MQDNPQKAVGKTGYSGAMERYQGYLQEETEYQAAIAAAAANLVRPLLESLTQMLSGNAAALGQIVEALAAQNERTEALERLIKRRLPVSPAQVRYMNEAIRNRTHDLLDGKDGLDKRAYTKLGNIIRRDVLVRCGAASLRELPEHEYSVSMEQIKMWSDALVIRDVMREARDRVESMELAKQSAGVDGA